jgi:peptide/nickel transport system substrate-binding protein
MNKEPIGMYVFRIIVGIGFLVFMGMLYWSSELIEEEVKNIQEEIQDIKSNQNSLRDEIDKSHEDIMQAIVHPIEQSAASFKNRSNIDSSFPNILKEDPFYKITLPKLLGPHFSPHGTFRNAVLGKPENLHPFSNWKQVSEWITQCTASVSRGQFGKYETFSPDMAIKMEERIDKTTGVPEFWVHLRDGVYWQPLRSSLFSENINLAPHFLQKHQVTSEDFKFFFDAIMNPYVQESGAVSLRTYFGDIQEIKILDKLTFIVRWKAENVQESNGKTVPKIKYIAKQLTGNLRPLASFVYKYFTDGSKIVPDDSDPNTYRTNSVWAQNFAQHWAQNIIPSCGAWIFDGMTDREIRFKRNTDHYFPLDVLVEASKVQFKDTPDAIWLDFRANKIDTYEIRSDQLLELTEFLKSPQYMEQKKQGNTINRLDYVARSYSYAGWNETKPYFNNKKIRQALTMAIDRKRIIRQNLNGMAIPINGPFFRYSSEYDPSIPLLPYDPQAAKHLLEQEGWYDREGQGVIGKEIGGKSIPFAFSLTYYVKNPAIKEVADYIATALKEIGIIVNLNGVDITDLSNVFDDKSFDAILLGWSLGTPPEDPKQLWSSVGAKEKGSSNAIGFSNPQIDKIIHDLEFESDHDKRIALYHQFDRIIHEEQPYTFLYTPKIALLYRDYVQNVFIPAKRQDLIPGADVAEPEPSIFWLRPHVDLTADNFEQVKDLKDKGQGH